MPSRRDFVGNLFTGTLVTLAAAGTANARCWQRLRRIKQGCQTPNEPKGPVYEINQPDYGKWQKLTEGMTENEVISLLGRPLERDPIPSGFNNLPQRVRDKYAFGWTYGWIRYEDRAMPNVYQFSVLFQAGRSINIEDPFQGQFSSNGKPTTPQLACPTGGASFYHYPRVTDFRWSPSSGEYPMRYLIEIEFEQPAIPTANQKFRTIFTSATRDSTHVPHYVDVFVGKSPGRWRVKAVNRLGESDWSPYEHFRHEQ